MNSSVQDLLNIKNNPGYLNWLAVGDGLRILCDGLRQYAGKKMKTLHSSLLSKLGGVSCSCPCKTGVKARVHTCLWATELRKLHCSKKKSSIPWHQSDSSLWHDPARGYWEIAKVFMPDLGNNWRNVKDPETTDSTGLLNLMFSCTDFTVQRNLLKRVREIRNDWAHAPNHLFSDSEKQTMFQGIVNLINDAELQCCTEVQNCRAAIEEARDADVSIWHDIDKQLRVLHELNCLEERKKERQLIKKLIKAVKEEKSSSAAEGLHRPAYHHHQPGRGRTYFSPFLSLFVALFQTIVAKTKCPRFVRPLLVLALVSGVGDKSVILSDTGCSRSNLKSPITHLDFQEFDFSSYLSYKRENFFGRRWFFSELENILELGRGSTGVLITGDPGSGKSALMSQLICSPFSSLLIHNNIIGYHLCDYSEKGKRSGKRFIRNLVDQIARHIPEYAEKVISSQQIQRELDKHCAGDPTGCFFATVVGPLRELKTKPDSLRYIVLDALDECFEKDGKTSPILDILSNKISMFPKWLKIIVSSRDWNAVTDKMPRALKRMTLDPTDERNLEDIRSYIRRFLSRNLLFTDRLLEAMRLTTTKEGINSWIEELTDRGEGNFLFVKTTLQSSMDESVGRINLQSLPTSLYDTYTMFFKRQFTENDLDRFRILFEVLLAAGNSFKSNEIEEILKRQNRTTEISKLSPFLRFGHDGTVKIYHQSFADWLTDQANGPGGFSVRKTRGHQYIVDFLLNRAGKQNATRLTFKELWRLYTHILSAGGPTASHKQALERLNVTEVRDPRNGRCILHALAKKVEAYPILEILLQTIFLVDIPDMEGKTPAFYAASEGAIDNLKLLMEKGANVNTIPKNVSSLDLVSAIVQNRSVEDCSLMHVAASHGHASVVQLLIKNNVSGTVTSRHGPTPLHLAAGNGHVEVVKLLYKNGAKADLVSLHHAAARNHSAVVEFLLSTAAVKDECLPCAPVNLAKFNRNVSLMAFHSSFCETALHAAVSRGHMNIVKLLLRFGNASLECKHYSGKTPLMDAVERQDVAMAEQLLAAGASGKTQCGRDLSRELKHRLCRIRSLYMKGLLYTVYCDKDACACGNRAIHLCAKYGQWEIAEKLIYKKKANLMDKNCKGETVWQIAALFHHENFIYQANCMLLHLNEESPAEYQRRTFKKLLKKFSMKAKPYQSSFQCDSSFDGLSPLHIAALMGKTMLNLVFKNASKIIPRLPMNCTNKHWIVPRYLAHLYESVHVLVGNPSTTNASHTTGDLNFVPLQYPDREAEYHIIYNYFYNSPSKRMNRDFYKSLPKLEGYDISNCPAFYDLLPKRNVLSAKDRCDTFTYTPATNTDSHENHDKFALQPQEFCQPKRPVCIICIEENMLREILAARRKFAEECFCAVVMRELQIWFTSRPRKNRQVSQFIAERMGWKDMSPDGDVQDRWPFYFLYNKVKNTYKSYSYLKTLNEGFQISHRSYPKYKEELGRD